MPVNDSSLTEMSSATAGHLPMNMTVGVADLRASSSGYRTGALSGKVTDSV
jgi:hypothetical protein